MKGARIQRPPVYRITLAQCAVLLLAWLGLNSLDPVMAYSAVLGGLIAVIPNAWFASRLFRRRGAQSASHIARAGYAGQIGKFFMAAAGFAAVFATVRPMEAWAVFAGYGLMIIIQVIGSWRLLR
jgi:ATP synthase protein I